MKFPYYKLGPDLLPWIEAKIKNEDKEKTFIFLVDSGADYSIFGPEIAEFLEVNIKKGRRIKTGGLGGSANTYYFEDIEIDVGGESFPIIAGFIKDRVMDGQTAGILGRQGFFDYFKVCIDEKNAEINLEPR
ncbi:MAG: aspartyl protease family protein [Candidatus Curtissbacteria bacterium]|nr:aspartyl protease family protein [Candidatus Curtissbacteria bacterium]